jgi:hypothetical protein
MTELARYFRINGGSFGPADPIVIEQFFKNAIYGGEQRLMLAVLQDAVECFQEHIQAQYVWEKKLFERQKIGFWRRIPTGLFRLRTFVKLYS